MSKNPDLKPANLALNIVRGALIGTVETVPGVSGGTVALVLGVYERLISAAGSAVTGFKEILAGTIKKDGQLQLAGRQKFKELPWGLLAAILLGMVLALVVMSHIMSTLVHTQPILTSAAFFGMVLASLYVPYQLAGSWRASDLIWALLAAGLVYAIVSLPAATTDVRDPGPLLIIVAAAIAVSALLLPGLSGSFLLLTFGLYQVTLKAVKDMDFAYLGFFMIGALIGLATIVKGLEWLLEHHRHTTLVLLTGVMLGALRALWPWTTENNQLEPAGDQAAAALMVCIAGFTLVVLVILAEKYFATQKTQNPPHQGSSRP